MKIAVANGITSLVLRFKLLDSSSAAGDGLTGLTISSAGLIISTIADNEATATAYTQAAGKLETITTLGTFATPTATKCRFKEVDATNHPGLYEVQIANARWAVSNARSVVVTISGATDLAECDAEIQLSEVPANTTAIGAVAGAEILSRVKTAIKELLGVLTGLTEAGSTDLVIKCGIEPDIGISGAMIGATFIILDGSVEFYKPRIITALTSTGSGHFDITIDPPLPDAPAYPLAFSIIPFTTLASVAKIGADGDTLETLSDQIDAGGTSANQTTLLARLTAARAGFLDYLNIGGNVAGQADIQAITQASRIRICAYQMERPDSSSVAYRINIYSYNELGQAEDLDAVPTVTAENNATTDRSANLGTVIRTAMGIYYVDYTVADAHAVEGIVFKVTATEDGTPTTYPAAAWVVDTTAVDYTSADRTRDDAVKAVTDNLPNSGALTTIATDAARLTADRAAVLTDLIDNGRLDAIFDTIKTKTDNLKNSWNDPAAAAIASQVDTTLTASHGAGSWSPGASSGLLLETTVAEVTDETHLILTAGSDVDDAYNVQAVVLYDASNSEYPSIRKVTDYDGGALTITLNEAADFTVLAGDTVKVFVTAPGTTAPTTSEVATAVAAALSGQTVTITSPLASSGAISLQQGDDYDNTEGRALDWINAAGDWGTGDITGATVAFRAVHSLDKTRTAIDIVGSVVTATGTQKVRVELTDEETALFLGEAWGYQLRLTLASGRIETIADSTVAVTASLVG